MPAQTTLSLRSPSIESTELVLSQHVLKPGLIACSVPLPRPHVIGDS